MLSVFLACDDPYQVARLMTDQLGWRLEFATPADSDDRLACVSLGGAEVMLGTAEQRWLPAASREHRGRRRHCVCPAAADERHHISS